MEMFFRVTLELLGGFGQTLRLFALTLVISIPLGLVVCFGSMSRFAPVRIPVRVFVWVIRGTPLMLQLILVFFGPGLLFGLPAMDRFQAALLAFSINYACYFSEIYRGGIESIPQGQYEAGQVLGMTKSQIFFRVVLLQMVKRILPPMAGEIITLVKDTALASTVAVSELMNVAKKQVSGTSSIEPYVVAMIIYLILNGVAEQVCKWVERKMNYYK